MQLRCNFISINKGFKKQSRSLWPQICKHKDALCMFMMFQRERWIVYERRLYNCYSNVTLAISFMIEVNSITHWTEWFSMIKPSIMFPMENLKVHCTCIAWLMHCTCIAWLMVKLLKMNSNTCTCAFTDFI